MAKEKTASLPLRAGMVLVRAALFIILLASGWNAAATEKLVAISSFKTNGITTFFVQNLQSADVTVTVEAKLNNYICAKELPYTATVPGRAKIEAFSITRDDEAKAADWSYKYFATWGALTVTHDDNHIYALPFASGESFPVSQGHHGGYSHTGGDAFAIDFKMPEGSAIHAARDGVVVGTKDDSSRGGPSKKFEWDANYVLIRHDDGTLGHYVHLQKGGNRVKVGEAVKAGDFIGRSGNTGHTTGPHLHFAVFKAASGKTRETVPVRFNGNGLVAGTLKEGATYRAL